MEGNNQPILSLVTKPRWMPDLKYPRWKKWYSTSTWLSPVTTTLNAHTLPSGMHIGTIQCAVRDYANSATAPTRRLSSSSVDTGIDITTPAYMLAGTEPSDVFGDTVVGLDHYNPPLEMAHDIASMFQMYGGGETTTQPFISARVLAINHKITFINYNIHPVKIWYAILPVGWEFESLNSTTTPSADPKNSQYRSIVIPAVMGSDDRDWET